MNSDDELRSAKFQLLFAPAEIVINDRFLDIWKENDFALHRDLAAVVSYSGDVDREKGNASNYGLFCL